MDKPKNYKFYRMVCINTRGREELELGKEYIVFCHPMTKREHRDYSVHIGEKVYTSKMFADCQ